MKNLKISNLAELYLLILKQIEKNNFEVLGDIGYTNTMSESDKNKHLAEDYLLSQYLEKTGSMDADKSKPLIDIPDISKDLAATKILQETSLKELTTIVSPEADKSSKWSAVDKDLIAETIKVKVIKEHLTNTNLEINKFGAVYTPYPLIEKMLDKLDEIYKSQHNGESIFENKDVTWLDPSSGSGSFLLVLKERLLKNLKKIVKQLDREKHILNKMLYGSEIQKKQYLISKKILNYKNRPGVEVHIHNGDSLIFDFWGKKFTVVIGNPPYQAAMEDGSRKAKNHNLWEQFVLKGIDLVEEEGYLIYIMPTSWMSPTWKHMDKTFRKYQLHHLEVNTIQDYFPGVGSQFCWFILQKKKPNKKIKTSIKCQFDGSNYELKEDFNQIPFLASLLSKESVSVLKKFYNGNHPKINFTADSNLHATGKKEFLSKTKDETFQYTVRHTNKQILYSSRKHRYHDLKKVIVTLSGYPIFEYDGGECGTTQNFMYKLVDSEEEGRKTSAIFNSKLYQFVFKICKWSGFNEPKVFLNVPLPEGDSFSDKEIYKIFNLTKKEIDLIEEVVG